MSEREEFRVVVVGAGLAGIAAAIKLERAGIDDVVVLEKADRVGGTWRDNTYPGCGCDIPSNVYSFTFNPNPDWNSTFALQPDILEYVEATAEKFDVYRKIRFRTEVTEARWDSEARRWLIDTTNGSFQSQFAVFAGGPITEPKLPDVPGIGTFTGDIFHSARWNHDLDLSGKRVAVIGTGASAVQFVPEIQPVVSQMYVFQRTASWVIPRVDMPVPGLLKSVFRKAPATQRGMRHGLDGILRLLTLAMRHEAAAKRLNIIGTSFLRAQVKDPELRKHLTPKFSLGCKRLLISNEFLPALTKPNVELVPHALQSVGEHSVTAADGTTCEVDVIIFGTGFDVSHPPISRHIRGEDGTMLSDAWTASPEAYLGTTTVNVPNAFIMLGPNLLVYNSFLGIAEDQMNYVIDAITKADKYGVEVLSLKPEVLREFNDDIQEALQHTVFNHGGCSSYYLDENGKNFAAWPYSTTLMRKRLSEFDIESYDTVPYKKSAPVS
ncbi:NAD(P)/FAD-dependent oxidoreductase [Hoyosella rhizosphaerae]|uniref:Cyclohexanone monooxygenase n=1 Tax=Hoyosella rhizosphaerae TaxID=1755582 RepID=A0A916TZ63_9ACTN|nr:NAD(P)/FAD-dependent oxidoreductase [Hoyosella rhizosphaerae]MBN4927310.1 NAD(P)/FAD-dependent oxidoreductase [Hoyosella rhizosphaerae]GGC52287.1 cyclohexanone monooxygenase [Hoyosella rhizosphaerae]